MSKSINEAAFNKILRSLYGNKWAPGLESKTRVINDKYSILASKESVGGVNSGTIAKKKPKDSHLEDDIYHRSTIFKKYKDDVVADTAIREVLAAHMVNFASSNTEGHEMSKVFFAKDASGDLNVGVRFYPFG